MQSVSIYLLPVRFLLAPLQGVKSFSLCLPLFLFSCS